VATQYNSSWDTIFNWNTFSLLKCDLRNFVRSQYHSVVDSVPAVLKEFNVKYPGFKQELGEQTVFDVANKLNKGGRIDKKESLKNPISQFTVYQF
jgi:putative DNA primase/helicase